MDDLNELRQAIDTCDRELLEIFLKRMHLVRQVAELKCTKNGPILHSEREKQVIAKVMRHIRDEDQEYRIEVEKFFEQVLMISRRYQSRKLFPYNIVLTGFMGAGKTVVGRELSGMLAMSCEDSDAVIEREAGLSISEIFSRHGESYFRALEREIIGRLARLGNTIIITGGGAVMDPANVKSLKKNGIIVFLEASLETVYARIKDCGNRPLLSGRMSLEAIRELYAKRYATYRACADITVNTDGKPPAQVAQEIIKNLGE